MAGKNRTKKKEGNLTKKEIINQIQARIKVPLAIIPIQEIFECSLNIISEALMKGRHIELRNFGVFEIQVRKQRIGRNPNSPNIDVVIPERPVVKFKAGKSLKEGIESQPIGTFTKS